MDSEPQHIVISNFTRVHRAYFVDVVQPVLTIVKSNSDSLVKYYRIAHKNIRLNFYSVVIAEKFSHALKHLETVSPIAANLTVELWDSISTNTVLDSLFDHASHTDQTATDSQESITDGFLGIFLAGEQTLNLFDQSSNTAYFWTRDANKLPDWLAAAPLRTIFHWFFSGSNTHLIHGAVIGMGNESILLSAKGGSGKSTTAISSIISGMNYLGDDYVAIESGREIIAHSLYNSAKVDATTMKHFPSLIKSVWNKLHKPEDKSIVFFSELFPTQMNSSSHLAAIMIPRIVHEQKTCIVPATKLEAMLALSPTTLFQLPLAHKQTLHELKTVIDKTPCYFLELGLPIADVPSVLKTFLQPLISVILPVFNTEKYLAAAIESVLNQTYANIELICINDGSTDSSLEILKSFGNRLIIVDHKQNGGIALARNDGIDIARGEYLAFMDADDLWEPQKLEMQLRCFKKNPDLDICFSHFRYFLSPELSEETKQKRFCPPLPMPGYISATALVKTSSFKQVGGFNPKWNVGEFIDWFERAKSLGLTHELIDDIFLLRRIHETNTGITDRSSRNDYVKIVKESLDRKRNQNT